MALKAPNGFTLIELLVSVAILMVVTGGVIVNYNRYNDTQKVHQAASTVKNNLRLAQSRATNGDKPAGGCTSLVGYEVRFGATSYTAQARCDPEGLIVGSDQTYRLETGLSFSIPPSPSTPIVFGVLSRGIDTDVTIAVTGAVAGSSQSYQFGVTRSGDMSEVTLSP